MKNAQEKIVPIILAGGNGTRLWPLSRAARPKQFLNLTGDLSLLQQTLLRVADKKTYLPPIIVTNQEYRFLVAEQALEIGVELHAILLEPEAKNTAAAIIVGCLFAAQKNKHQLVHVLPSDHAIVEDQLYVDAIRNAKKSAMSGKLVTFGIKPNSPIMGYGYIKASQKEKNGAISIDAFVEKPDQKSAIQMVKSQNYYWNSGMFLFEAAVFLKECKNLVPKVLSAVTKSMKLARSDLDFIRLEEISFAQSPNISVDYAVFERTELASMVPTQIDWSDLGAWDAVWKAGNRDKNNNLHHGPNSLNDTTNSLVISEKLHVAVEGLDGIAVIASEDAIYVGPLSSAQNVGALVKRLKAQEKTKRLTQSHKTTYRPWGGYSSVEEGERFQVKRLFIKPLKRLSLQMHHHRSEHWIVVRGTAEAQIGNETKVIRENQSIYIPQGTIHRLYNPGKILLELIEVQTGSYLEEDDIVRLEDEFGRQ